MKGDVKAKAGFGRVEKEPGGLLYIVVGTAAPEVGAVGGPAVAPFNARDTLGVDGFELWHVPALDAEINVNLVTDKFVIRAGLSRNKIRRKVRLPVVKFQIGSAQTVINVAVSSNSGGRVMIFIFTTTQSVVHEVNSNGGISQ